MESALGFLVRYGVMGHVGRFRSDPGSGLVLERGQAVVVETDRGTELGEVLVPAAGQPPPDRLLRPAGPVDLANARAAEDLRGERYFLFSRILGEEGWPVELIDVEPLLDRSTTILHVLGPADVDLTVLRAHLRSRCDFDVVLEPWGAASPRGDAEPGREQADAGCGSCGAGGGCGSCSAHPRRSTAVMTEPAQSDVQQVGHCTTLSHSACSSCGVAQWRLAAKH
jgi:hypothetical protein